MTLETQSPYGSIADLEWADLWDEYDRRMRASIEAHERPKEKYGLTDCGGGAFLQDLRLVDPSGECIVAIQRSTALLRKAEEALKKQVVGLPEGWRSEKILNRIICILEYEDCRLRSDIIRAFRRMKCDNDSLSDLCVLAKTENGFALAVEAIGKVGSKDALNALRGLAQFAGEDEIKLKQLSDAAVEISVRMGEPKVVALLVNRLIAAFGQLHDAEVKASEVPDEVRDAPEQIIEKILFVIDQSRETISPRLLEQLVSLGSINPAASPNGTENFENPHLGINQAIISQSLEPIRDAARGELERRRMAS